MDFQKTKVNVSLSVIVVSINGLHFFTNNLSVSMKRGLIGAVPIFTLKRP